MFGLQATRHMSALLTNNTRRSAAGMPTARALALPARPGQLGRAVAEGRARVLPGERRRVHWPPVAGERRHPETPCPPGQWRGPTFSGDMQAGAVVVGASGAAVCHTAPNRPG